MFFYLKKENKPLEVEMIFFSVVRPRFLYNVLCIALDNRKLWLEMVFIVERWRLYKFLLLYAHLTTLLNIEKKFNVFPGGRKAEFCIQRFL